jgi:hypothetical protein
MEYAILIGATALLTVALIVISGILASKKRRKKLDALFGKIPEHKSVEQSVKNYWDAFSKSYPDQNHIDQTTWNDLDMDAVFNRINSCLTSVGEEYLFATLHILTNDEILSKREKWLNFLGTVIRG